MPKEYSLNADLDSLETAEPFDSTPKISNETEYHRGTIDNIGKSISFLFFDEEDEEKESSLNEQKKQPRAYSLQPKPSLVQPEVQNNDEAILPSGTEKFLSDLFDEKDELVIEDWQKEPRGEESTKLDGFFISLNTSKKSTLKHNKPPIGANRKSLKP